MKPRKLHIVLIGLSLIVFGLYSNSDLLKGKLKVIPATKVKQVRQSVSSTPSTLSKVDFDRIEKARKQYESALPENGRQYEPKEKGWIIQFKEQSVVDRLIAESGSQFLLGGKSESLKQNAKQVIKLRSAIKSQHRAFLEQYSLASKVLSESTDLVNTVSLLIDGGLAYKLQEDNRVSLVSPNSTIHSTLDTSVPLTNAPPVWQTQSKSGVGRLNGQDIIIAVIDTGIDYDHPDVRGAYVGIGYDFVNSDNDPMDDQGHGTHVAATAAGSGAYIGVAPGASLVAYKVLDNTGSGYWNNAISAMEWSMDPNQDGDFSDSVDVVNMSIGGWGNSNSPASRAADTLMEAGVITVIAAGNDGPSGYRIGAPGASRKSITVGAISRDMQMARFSSRGPAVGSSNLDTIPKPDIVAPGVDICASLASQSSWSPNCGPNVNSHRLLSGTSMATPHVAGAAAILRQQYPNISAFDIKKLMMSSSTDLGFEWYSQGAGLVNLEYGIVAPITATPKAVDTVIANTEIKYIQDVVFESVDGAAAMVTLRPGPQHTKISKSNPFVKKPAPTLAPSNNTVTIEDKDARIVANRQSFCVERGAPQTVNVKTIFAQQVAKKYDAMFIADIQPIRGGCASPQLLGTSNEQKLPIRIKKSYKFVAEFVPTQLIDPREYKVVDFAIVTPDSIEMNLINPRLSGGLGQNLRYEYFVDFDKFDLISVAETFANVNGNHQGAISFMAVPVKLAVSTHAVIQESNSRRLDRDVQNILQGEQMDKYAQFVNFQNGWWTGFSAGIYYLPHYFTWGAPQSFEFAVYAGFSPGVSGDYSVTGSLQGVEHGKDWSIATKVGFFPFDSLGYVSNSLVSRYVSFTTWIQNSFNKLDHANRRPSIRNNPSQYNDLHNSYGQIWMGPNAYEVVVPQNMPGWFNGVQNNEDWSEYMFSTRFNYPFVTNATASQQPADYFRSFNIFTWIDSTPANWCNPRQSIYVKDQGLHYMNFSQNLVGSVDMISPLNEHLGAPNGYEFNLPDLDEFELRVSIPSLSNWSDTMRIASTYFPDRNCRNYYRMP